MLLVAYLRRPEVRVRALSERDIERLTPMITESANEPALEYYLLSGDSGLAELTDTVGMREFSGGRSHGWGAVSASATDWVRFYLNLRRWIPERHREFAMGLFSSIAPEQSWGIPVAAAPAGWSAFFKGGWIPNDRGWIIIQNARLVKADEKMAISILTEARPSYEVGIYDLQLTAWEVLSRHPLHPRATG